MLSEKDVSIVYETLLSAPGMSESVKLDLRIQRKNILLLVTVVERGLQEKPGEPVDGLIKAAGTASMDALLQIGSELLQKAGLSEMNEKLHTLRPASK